jgi:hypothetical protein
MGALLLKGDLAQGDRRAGHVLRKALHGSRIGGIQPDRAVDAETGPTPTQKALGAVALDEAEVKEQGQHARAERLCHLLEISEGDVEEAAVMVESSFQEDSVPVGVEAQELA